MTGHETTRNLNLADIKINSKFRFMNKIKSMSNHERSLSIKFRNNGNFVPYTSERNQFGQILDP